MSWRVGGNSAAASGRIFMASPCSLQDRRSEFQPLSPEELGGPAMPMEITGEFESSEVLASGAWRVSVWKVENDSRRRVKVIIAQGSWQRANTSQVY